MAWSHPQWDRHREVGMRPEALPQEAAYLRTEALGLVHGDDHVGHDEEGVFLL